MERDSQEAIIDADDTGMLEQQRETIETELEEDLEEPNVEGDEDEET